MLRTVQSLPLERAFDTGLRPDPFPDRAASLLPGLLAATRTGLPPASDDELTTADQPPTRSTSCLLGARERLSEQLLRSRCIPSGMELFTASGRPPWDVIVSAIDTTDYMILILGGRYGDRWERRGQLH